MPVRPILVLSAVLSAAPLTAQVPLVGTWLFDEVSGLTAFDSGPFGNDGSLMQFTASQTAWVPGMFGNAIQLDGVDDYVDIATNGGLPIYRGDGSPFSICFWVKAPAQEDHRVYAEGSQTNNSPLFTLGSGRISLGSGDKFTAFIRNDGGIAVAKLESVTPVFDDTWHHVCYVDVAGDAKAYVDGVLDPGVFDYRINGGYGARGTQTSQYGTYTMDQVAVGAVLRSGTAAHLQGLVDDLRIYGFALSAADAQTVFTGGFPGQCRASIGEFGIGCGAGPFAIAASGSAVLGGAGVQLSVANGTPSAPTFLCWGFGLISPMDLGPLGFTGCVAYPQSPDCTVVGVLDPSGALTFSPIAVPNNASLACGQVNLQAAAVGSTIEFSHAVIVTMGF